MQQVVNRGKREAQENMLFDLNVLNSLDPKGPPLLHLYDWVHPSATFGHFIEPEKLFKGLSAFDLAKRPTGGGILFHLWDVTFSLFIPKEHPGYQDDVMECYRYVGEIVRESLKPYVSGEDSLDLLKKEDGEKSRYLKNFCFAAGTEFDVMRGKKKVAGGAQRRKRGGYLHQGSISVGEPNFSLLEESLLEGKSVIPHMERSTYFFLSKEVTLKELEELKDEIRSSLQKTFLSL